MAWRAPSRRLPLSGIGPANDIPIAQRRVARRQAEHFFERRMPVKAAIVAKDEFVEICIDVLATQAGGVAKPSGDGTAVAALLRPSFINCQRTLLAPFPLEARKRERVRCS